jgi:hypothetical protein
VSATEQYAQSAPVQVVPEYYPQNTPQHAPEASAQQTYYQAAAPRHEEMPTQHSSLSAPSAPDHSAPGEYRASGKSLGAALGKAASPRLGSNGSPASGRGGSEDLAEPADRPGTGPLEDQIKGKGAVRRKRSYSRELERMQQENLRRKAEENGWA